MAGAAACGRLWTPEIRFFAVAWLVMLLYALGWYTPAFRALYAVLPGVNLYRRPADAVFLIGALSAVLAGYAVHRLFESPWRQIPPAATWTAFAVAGIAAIAALTFAIRLERVDRLAWPLAGAGLSFAVAAAAIWWTRDRIALTAGRAAFGLAAVTALDLGINNGPSTSSALPTAFYDVLEPATKDPTIALLKSRVVVGETRRDRVELAGLGFHWPNASMTHRLENTLGYNPVRLGLYSRATGAEDHVGLPDQRKFSKLMPSYRSLLADMLGIRFIATGAPIETMDPSLRPGDLTLVARTGDSHFVYENPRALPRVVLSTQASAADFDAILAGGRWPEAFDPRQQVLLAAPPAPPTIAPAADAQIATGTSAARIVSYRNTEIVIETESVVAGHAVLFDVWHPWWLAEVDGAPVPLLRANVLFRAVAVPAGKHRIVLRFRPLAGLAGSLTGSR
jgi:hypothetical protein